MKFHKRILLLLLSTLSLIAIESSPLSAGGGKGKFGLFDACDIFLKRAHRLSTKQRYYATTREREYFFNPARNQYYYYEDPRQKVELVKPGQEVDSQTIKDDIQQRAKIKKEEDDGDFSSYQMPEYKKKTNRKPLR